MKTIQQYCDVVDRMKQDPACKQAVLEKARRSRISLTKRGTVTGSAAAAALIALNIGIGGYILHRAADDSMSENSQTIEVTETVQTTVSAEITAVQTVTTAKPQKLSGEKTVTVTAADTDRETLTVPQTAAEPAAQTAAPAVTEPAAQTTAQPKQDPVPPAAEVKPKTDRLSYMLVPADRSYTFSWEEAEEPVVMHVRPGEQFKLQLRVWNDPGVASFRVPYNMSECDLLSGTGSQYYTGTFFSAGVHDTYNCMDRFLCFEGTGDGSNGAPDGAAAAECTLIAPSVPGSYLIREYVSPEDYTINRLSDGTTVKVHLNHVYADAEQTQKVYYTVSGVKVIVDEDASAPFGKEGALADPEAAEGLTLYIELVTARAGQKNVPVNICVKGSGSAPFASGSMLLCCDPALKPLVYDSETMPGVTAFDYDMVGIRVEGTLLEHAPQISSSKMPGIGVHLGFNNYMSSGLGPSGRAGIISNGTSQADAAITEDGVLLTVCFDMPEECGTYRIFWDYANFGGGTREEPGCLPDQTVHSFIPGNITVIP